MPQLGTPEIIIIAVVILLLFGSRKLPDAARSIGRSMRIFKSEVKGMHDDDKPAVAAPVQPVPPAAAPTPETTAAAGLSKDTPAA